MATRREIRAEDFLYVFQRPFEPLFFPKGSNEHMVLFDIPSELLDSRMQEAALDVRSRNWHAHEVIAITYNPVNLPKIELPQQLKKNENFSILIPFHAELASYLIDIFTGISTLQDLMAVVVFCVGKLNSYLLNYALSVALLHRDDTKHLNLPALYENFPVKFFNASVISECRTEASIFRPENRKHIQIPKDWTASNLDPEHRLWYFREDLGVNLHHWHWHLVYPNHGDKKVVDKDRRGELFYYMHQQVVARYNAERFCNKLYCVEKLDWDQPISDGYFSKLTSANASKNWPSRSPNAKLTNINRKAEPLQVDLHDLERWRERLYEAIHKGYILEKYENESGDSEVRPVKLTVETGIDVLGNLVEASILSKNLDYYGNIHNLGHMVVALVHDPDFRYLEYSGVMGDNATAMRDPMFYRWHAFIDDIFQDYKKSLAPYKIEELKYNPIKIRDLEINSDNGTKNEFNTFLQKSTVNLSNGLDFMADLGPMLVDVHLQHDTFTYIIKVENESHDVLKGTIRIFLAPCYDERGIEMKFNDQRTLFIELDKFTVTFQSGENVVTRSSKDSSVTIPFEGTFRNLNKTLNGDAQTHKSGLCGCGWPEHMLIPKGTPEGYPCQLFVMVSDYEKDKVEQGDIPCGDAVSYCGVKDKKYPDKRAMGFPFDRKAPDNTCTLSKFIKQYPNMHVKTLNIRFIPGEPRE